MSGLLGLSTQYLRGERSTLALFFMHGQRWSEAIPIMEFDEMFFAKG